MLSCNTSQSVFTWVPSSKTSSLLKTSSCPQKLPKICHFPTFSKNKRGNKSFSFTYSSLPPGWESCQSCWLPYLLAVPRGHAGNRPSTSLYWSWHWQAVVLQDSLVAAMVSTCLQYSVYGMTNWVETGSLLNTEDDAVGVCNWFLWQRVHQVLPRLI